MEPTNGAVVEGPEVSVVSPSAKPELDAFAEDTRFQQRFWAAERVAWVGYLLLIILALLGLTGSGGPLAHSVTATAYGTITYPQVTRWQTPDTLVVDLPRNNDKRIALELDHEFLRTFEIISALPEPSSVAATGRDIRYVFELRGSGQITFHLRAMRPSVLNTVIRVNDVDASIRVVVLP